MTIEEAKIVFLNRGYVEVEGGTIYDADKWRESCCVISKWLEQEPCEDEYIKVPKKALKYRTAGMVAYNVEWLKNHFDIERVVICGAQEPCEDAISREELLKAINTWDKFGVDDTNSLFRLDNLSLPHYVAYIHYDDVVKCIKGMPSVKPQEPKTGWHIAHGMYEDRFWCSCGYIRIMDSGMNEWKFCPVCGGARMESEKNE